MHKRWEERLASKSRIDECARKSECRVTLHGVLALATLYIIRSKPCPLPCLLRGSNSSGERGNR